MAGITVRWRERNMDEDGHRIYRSETTMDLDNMPSAIAELGPNVEMYVDEDVEEGKTYHYIVSAYKGNEERFGQEFTVNTQYSLGPGSATLVGGSINAGFFGEVSGDELFGYDELSFITQMTQGTLQYDDESQWLKFVLDGEILYVAKKPMRSGISWNHIHSNGCVFGDTVVEKNGYQFKTTLLKGANSDPYPGSTGYDPSYTHGSEWNRLMYHIHDGNHTESKNTMMSEGILNGASGTWASYSDSDLLVYRGNGSRSWCQESNVSNRLSRGNDGVSYAYSHSSSSTSANTRSFGWRVALRLVR